MESWEELQERHRSEIRALKAEVMRVKKSASVGDKKKKKDSVVQIAQMESDLADRQSREEREFHEAHKDLFASPAPSADTTNAVPAAENENADTESQSEASPVPRVTRAAKRRTRKAEKESEAREEAERDAAAAPNLRAEEDAALVALLSQLKLSIKRVPADGNCLFYAIAAQQSDERYKEQASLRRAAADYMRSHADDFMPFVTDAEGEPILDETGFNEYLKSLESTSMWGGQLEITALSHALRRPVHIFTATAPRLVIGEDYGDATPIRLAYHKHEYGLGEHYNSVEENA